VSRNEKSIEFAGFIQIELSEQDISVLEQSEVSPDEFLLWIAQICRNGFRFALVPDGKTKTIKATLQCVDETSTASGWMLSGEGPTVPDALLVLRYKNDVKMGGDWRPFLTKAREVKRFR